MVGRRADNAWLPLTGTALLGVVGGVRLRMVPPRSQVYPGLTWGINKFMYRATDELRPAGQATRDGVRASVRFSAGVVVAAIAFAAVAAVWVGTCGESTFDVVACGAPQLTVLAIGGPLILLGGASVAFVRAYQAWRHDGNWWPWQASGSALTIAMLIVIAYSV